MLMRFKTPQDALILGPCDFVHWGSHFPTLSPGKRRKDGARRWYRNKRSETWGGCNAGPMQAAVQRATSRAGPSNPDATCDLGPPEAAGAAAPAGCGGAPKGL